MMLFFRWCIPSDHMYCPETIKRMNAESSLDWPDEVNRALVTIKDALRQVSEVDAQIKSAGQLRAARPDLTQQLELAEEFFIAKRKALLDLEGPVSTLAGICEALVSLLQRYETERGTLQGRLLVVEHDSSNDTDSIRKELEPILAQVSQRCERIRVTIQEIRGVLHEYASEYSRERLSTRDKIRWFVGRKGATGALEIVQE